LSRHLSLAGDLGPGAFALATEHLLADSLGFIWMPRVTHEQRPAFEARLREQGGANGLREVDERGALRPAGVRDEYFPVRYVGSRHLGERLPGLDLASHPGRREILQRAREREGL